MSGALLFGVCLLGQATMQDDKTNIMKQQIMNKVNAIDNKSDCDRVILNIAFSFAGARNKDKRQKLLFELTGKEYPKAKAGVHEIEKVIRELANH